MTRAMTAKERRDAALAAWLAVREAPPSRERDRILSALMREHEGMISLVAHKFRLWSMAIEDCLQDARIGFLAAARTWTPDGGAEFGTLLFHCARRQILRSIHEQSRLLRLPMYVSSLVPKVRSIAAEMAERGERVTVEAVTARLEAMGGAYRASLRSVATAMEVVDHHVSLDAAVDFDGGGVRPRLDRVIDEAALRGDAEVELAQRRQDVERALKSLTAFEEFVLRARFGLDGNPHSLADIARHAGLTRERARQIEAIALEKLRNPPWPLHAVRAPLAQMLGPARLVGTHTVHA